MGTQFRGCLLLLVVLYAVAATETLNKTNIKDKETDNFYQYVDDDTDDKDEVLFSEDKPCPRDCVCIKMQGYKIAKCNRLEVGVQVFGKDITDLVIENADPRFPIDLNDYIFENLGLTQAASIKIVNSTIGYIGPKAFHGLHQLYSVDLSNNNLRYLDPETFVHNKKLLQITLAYNNLYFPARDTHEYFLNTSLVQELDISYCNIKYLTVDAFKNMRGLMYLNVAGNNISDLDPDTFKYLLDLEELDLSDNSIKSLPDDIFSQNEELVTLHIQRNPIYSVYGLQVPELLTLNAGQTNIDMVGPSMFSGMKYIANLNLSSNSIKKIHNQAFHELVELNYLDLSYNDLDYISSILIKRNLELDIFKISNNPNLKHLPENGFECAEQFNINLFDASNCGLEEIYDNSLSTFTALYQINLSGNNIKDISPKVFSKCPKLIQINLAYNKLTTLDNKVFEFNNELSKLNLQGNPLKVISADVFAFTPVLTWMDISHTHLTTLWKDNATNRPSSFLKNITFLNVSHSHITEIKQSQLANSNKLTTLDIRNNPLACGREFVDLISWLSNKKVKLNGPKMVANLGQDDKEGEENVTNWNELAQKICGSTLPHPVELLPSSPVSDEEIWERIDKDAEGNFDLKNTLDDGKVADDNKTDKKDKDALLDDVNDDVDDDLDDEEEDDEEEDEDDASENYDDDSDDVQLKVKLIEKPKTVLPKLPVTQVKEKMQITLIEEDDTRKMDELIEQEVAVEPLEDDEQEEGEYDFLWVLVIAVLTALLLLLVIGKIVSMIFSRRNQQSRYNSAIIAAMGQSGRTKKDCGLVYQQLSEDLKGPKTPILSRYQPLQSITVSTNMSYESTPFHHNNVVPEAV